MENTSLFFLAFVFLSFHERIKTDGCQQFSFTSPSMNNYSCPGSNITYTCVQSSSANGVSTVWSGSAFQCSSSANSIVLIQRTGGSFLSFTPMSCGSLSAVTTNVINNTNGTSLCYTSVLTIPAVLALNGNSVQCADFTGAVVVGSDTLKIISPPGAPNVMASTIGPDMVLVVVNSSSSGGLPTSYNVNISNSSNVYTKSTPAFLNGSAMVTFTGLTNTTTYTISAVAINCAGSSNPATTILVSWPATTTSPSPSSGITTLSPTATPTPKPPDPYIGIIVGSVIGVVVLVVLIVISIVICVFLCKSSNGSKPNKMDGQDGQPLAQVKVELSEEPVPARPPRQVPAEESHVKTQANRVPIEEALYDGNVGPGGMVTTGRGGYTQEAQYSTPDVSKKNADKQMYAEVQIGTAPKNTASSSKKGKGVLPPPSTQEGVFYSTVKI